MKLIDLIKSMNTPDEWDGSALGSLEVVFDTAHEFDLELLSAYIYEGKIHVDVGKV